MSIHYFLCLRFFTLFDALCAEFRRRMLLKMCHRNLFPARDTHHPNDCWKNLSAHPSSSFPSVPSSSIRSHIADGFDLQG